MCHSLRNIHKERDRPLLMREAAADRECSRQGLINLLSLVLLSEATVNMKYPISTLEQQIERNSNESSFLFSKILYQIIYPIPILEQDKI